MIPEDFQVKKEERREEPKGGGEGKAYIYSAHAIRVTVSMAWLNRAPLKPIATESELVQTLQVCTASWPGTRGLSGLRRISYTKWV